jgi:hypothetical protein
MIRVLTRIISGIHQNPNSGIDSNDVRVYTVIVETRNEKDPENRTTTMTTATTRKADIHVNRAPKGGAISPVNGRFYLGGQFMPMVAAEKAEKAETVNKPAPMVGSVRQVAWANRLRSEALVALDAEIHVRRLFIAGPVRSQADDARKAIKPFLVARHTLMTERSAASVIDRRADLA